MTANEIQHQDLDDIRGILAQVQTVRNTVHGITLDAITETGITIYATKRSQQTHANAFVWITGPFKRIWTPHNVRPSSIGSCGVLLEMFSYSNQPSHQAFWTDSKTARKGRWSRP